MNATGYGLDLSGYSGGKTRLAVAQRTTSGRIDIELLRNSVFSKALGGEKPLRNQIEEEKKELTSMLKDGIVAVDIPVDLQGLKEFSTIYERVWELTKRPVDKALGGLPPLADKIGSPVARFQYLLRDTGIEYCLGESLYETYPKATLDLRSLRPQSYKKSVSIWGNAGWCVQNGNNKSVSATKRILESFGFTSATPYLQVDDNDIDASICALTALTKALKKDEYLLEGDSLDNIIRKNLNTNNPSQYTRIIQSPLGYVLLDKDNWFETVYIRERS
jgi:hypothetical protein